MGDMKQNPQGVAHRVRQRSLRIAEANPADRGGIVHVFARFSIGAIGIGARQISEDQFRGVKAQRVGEVIVPGAL